jgi:hypothetical protein
MTALYLKVSSSSMTVEGGLPRIHSSSFLPPTFPQLFPVPSHKFPSLTVFLRLFSSSFHLLCIFVAQVKYFSFPFTSSFLLLCIFLSQEEYFALSFSSSFRHFSQVSSVS